MEQTKRILNKIAFTAALMVFPLGNLFAQVESEAATTDDEITITSTERKLLAEKIETRLEALTMDSVLMSFEIGEDESEMSLADDLYDGQWNNQYLKSYSDITIPDNYLIDLSSFVMPFEGRVTSHFGHRRGRFHYGTDIKVQVGDTIVAAFEGRVRVKQFEKRGYGYYLVLRHPNGLETVYGHLSKFLVDIDENVVAGQAIALGGNTGRSTGSHLHFECRFVGQAIDPTELFDFDNFCTYDMYYIFEKSKINMVSKNNSNYSPGSQYAKYHRIRNGDTLSVIAKRYGVSVNTLCRLNGISTKTILRVGRTIRYS